MKLTGERLLQVGVAVATVGATLGSGWGIWAAQSPTARLWEWPMLLGIGVGVFGGAIIFASFFVSDDSTGEGRRIKQKQSGGKGSVNFQAGGDILYHNKKDDRP